MESNDRFDFEAERRLYHLDPELHSRFRSAVFALQYTLSNFKMIFPEFTDHSSLHSMTVIDFCNRLIGDRLDRLNADELYVLLTACYCHDTGMGITMKDYEQFSREIDFGNYFETHSRDDYAVTIRDFHHEFSGLFIRKNARLFDIPSEAHCQAIVQVARGHRRTDLMDEKEYPIEFSLPNGNTVCLPYLAALIRLADEIDVAASRNPILLYDIESLTDKTQIIENRKVRAVRRMEIREDFFVMYVDPSDREILRLLYGMAAKMQRTLDTCRAAVLGRTPHVITQQRIELVELSP